MQPFAGGDSPPRPGIWVPSAGLVGTYLVLRFPDGRLPSSCWRLVAGLAVVALIFWVFSEALLPGPLSETPGVAIAASKSGDAAVPQTVSG